MNIIRAEAIVGYEIGVHDEGEYKVLIGTHPQYGYTINVRDTDLSSALGYFVGLNYKAISAVVLAEQRYRCLFCDLIKPLQIDHIVMRSHGRLDVRTNLRGLCPACHGKRHGGERCEIQPSIPSAS